MSDEFFNQDGTGNVTDQTSDTGMYSAPESQTYSAPEPDVQSETQSVQQETFTLFRETYHSVTSRFFSNNTCWKLIFAIHFISPTRLNKILFFYCIIMHYPV